MVSRSLLVTICLLLGSCSTPSLSIEFLSYSPDVGCQDSEDNGGTSSAIKIPCRQVNGVLAHAVWED